MGLEVVGDSAAAVCFHSSSFRAPCTLPMFQCTHIYREGNFVTDKLANLGLPCRCVAYSWWDNAPISIIKSLLEDSSPMGLANRIDFQPHFLNKFLCFSPRKNK